MKTRLSLIGIALCAGTTSSLADVVKVSPDRTFGILDAVPAAAQAGQPWIRPAVFRPVQVYWAGLMATLAKAPDESQPNAWSRAVVLWLPMPDGTFARFRVVDSPVMEPALAAEFPNIKTFLGQGIDDPSASVRLDYTPLGFHAQVLSPHGAAYIDPYSRDDTMNYAVYYKRDYLKADDGWQCLTTGEFAGPEGGVIDTPSGATLRTYRLACACTGEYAAVFGGTVANAQAAIVTAINRVSGVYETELALRMVLVANNTNIVYTNASTDPYTNSNGSTMLSQNQTTCDSVIGNANYDIGHVFSTGGGGIAGLGVVGVAGNKARGVTGLPSPIGDPFYIDYVAHEMGHQFGANHNFNSQTGSCGGGNRSGTHAYEPGSASTIMGYAGICGADDLQPHSDPYFGFDGHDAIIAYTSGGAGIGNQQTATGNTPPTVNAGLDYTIPRNTPFALTAAGSDGNGDPITFSWEQRDLGAATALSQGDTGSGPIIRVFNPLSSPTRTIPRLSNLLSNTFAIGEILPATNRSLNFRACIRDLHNGIGGFNNDDMLITVNSASGPFAVTAPNTAVSWSAVQTVTWNVAGTSAAPVNCANVAILLSTDGGNTFPTTLVASTPNDGSEAVTLPNISTSLARIKVASLANIFFDISNTNFTITPGSACPSFTQHPSAQLTCDGGSVIFQVAANGAPAPTYQWYRNNLLLPNGGNISGATTNTLTIDPVSFSDQGSYTCVATNNCGSQTSNGAALTVEGTPTITQQPQSQAVTVGSPVTFTVAANFAIAYQWKKNNVNIPGAVAASYQIASAQQSDAGNYSCFIPGNCGFTSSSSATLTIVTCYPNCDLSTTPPVLNVQDFSCFLNLYAAGCT